MSIKSNTKPLRTVKISNSGSWLHDGDIWNVDGATGYTEEIIRRKLDLRPQTKFTETKEKPIHPIPAGYWQ